MEINRGLKLSFRIIGGLILLSSIAPLALGIWSFSRTTAFRKTAVTTTGVVIELVEKTGSEGGSLFAPRVRFQDQEGNQHEITGSTASQPPRYLVGEAIEILYNPDRPQEFRTTDWFSVWGLSVLGFGLAGSALLFAALFAFLGPIILQGFISAFSAPKKATESSPPSR